MDRRIQNTFNAYWLLMYGKERKDVDFRVLRALADMSFDGALDGRAFLADCMQVMKPYLEMDGEISTDDWMQLSEAAAELYKRYGQHSTVCGPVITEICGYLDMRDKLRRMKI